MASGTLSMRRRRKRGRSDALRRAHDAGLRVKPVGDQLLVQGPRRAELLVRLLAAHKAEVMVALTEADERARPASRKCRAAVGAEYWRDLFDERAAHHEFDGGYSRADAERLAFGEMILEWHRLLGVPPEPNHCAGCGGELPGEGGFYLCDGAYVHFDGVRGVDCIVKYGKKWRGAAVAALRMLGFDPPQGFDLL
jgi:hypothetical protein